MTEAGWKDLLASKGENQPALQALARLKIPITIGEHRLTLPQMQKLWDGVMNKALSLAMFPPKKYFFDMIPTLEDAKKSGTLWE